MKLHLPVIILFLATMLVAAQCGPAPASQSAAPVAENSQPKIMVMNAWSRPSPMMAGNGAVYMTLTNEGGQPDKLVSAESDIAAAVELHESKIENDVMKMSPVASIEVPAGGSTSLEPGGLHVMLINLKQELTPGDKISLTLNFEQSGPLTIEAEVQEPGAMDGQMKMDN